MERIDPDRLIQVRKARGLSRRQLAKSSSVSLRQLARIEANEYAVEVRDYTMDRLAASLDVKRSVLAGEASLPAKLDFPESQPAKVVPEVLAELRKRTGWSRRELAEKARVSPQLIERIESQTEPVTVQPRSLERLARAFGPEVEQSVLSGEIELKPAPPTPEQLAVTVRSTPGLRLAYELVERRYGAAPKDLYVLAPALFVLLAEGSLDWRRRKLKQAEEAKGALDELGRSNPTLYFAKGYYQQAFDWGLGVEADSIKKGDVLGRDVWNGHGMMQWGFTEDDVTVTPFADYLEELAKQVSSPDLLKFNDMLLANQGVDVWGANPYSVCQGDLDVIVGDSRHARWALEWGNVRISEIPDDLMPEDLASESEDVKKRRSAWLASKLDDDVREKMERHQAFLELLDRTLAQDEADREGE